MEDVETTETAATEKTDKRTGPRPLPEGYMRCVLPPHVTAVIEAKRQQLTEQIGGVVEITLDQARDAVFAQIGALNAQ